VFTVPNAPDAGWSSRCDRLLRDSKSVAVFALAFIRPGAYGVALLTGRGVVGRGWFGDLFRVCVRSLTRLVRSRNRGRRWELRPPICWKMASIAARQIERDSTKAHLFEAISGLAGTMTASENGSMVRWWLLDSADTGIGQ
jgi:hypothetical protein